MQRSVGDYMMDTMGGWEGVPRWQEDNSTLSEPNRNFRKIERATKSVPQCSGLRTRVQNEFRGTD